MSAFYSDIRKTVDGQQHVLLATTVYENPDVSYTFALARSREALTAAGIQSSLMILSGNCHVDDARNSVVREFLQTDCTDLVFLDADVSWDPNTLVRLCKIDRSIVGGVYPYREQHAEKMPVRMLPGAHIKDGLLEVEGLPTGFMKIKRDVLVCLAHGAPHYGKTRDIPLLFQRTLRNGERFGGDIGFCMDWRAKGGMVYAATELSLSHAGNLVQNGSLGEYLRLQEGSTFAYVADLIRRGQMTRETLSEAVRASGNVWGAKEDVLLTCIGFARRASLPVLELGSGLTTVLMAAAGARVHCLEHKSSWAHRTDEMAAQAGVADRVIIHVHSLVNGFYLAPRALPEEFAFMLVDGPPRTEGDRKLFTSMVRNIPQTVILDDMDDPASADWAKAWASKTGRKVILHDGRVMVLR